MKLLRRKLKNGISVLMEKRELPVVSISISNRFGAAYEESKIKGIAHFMEHLVFTGTETRTHEDISREIEKKGGILNAFTANEITSFWCKLPSEHLFVGLDILSDMLLHPKIDKGKFEKEKRVILEEIKMYHDDPGKHVYEQIVKNLYDGPFGEGIMGGMKSVSSLDRDFVYKYFKEHYASDDYIVIIVGNANFGKACEYLEKTFPTGKAEFKIRPISLKNKETVEERAGIDQAHFVFAVHAPLMNSKDYMALEVLDAYLADGMSSRLFLKIREEKGLAYAVQGGINTEKSYSYYSIYAGTTKEAMPEVRKIILEEFGLVDAMLEKDLKEAKERLIGLRKVTSEESSKVMSEILFQELATKAEDYYEHEKRIREVTLEQVKALAKKLIKSYSSAAIVPK